MGLCAEYSKKVKKVYLYGHVDNWHQESKLLKNHTTMATVAIEYSSLRFENYKTKVKEIFGTYKSLGSSSLSLCPEGCMSKENVKGIYTNVVHEAANGKVSERKKYQQLVDYLHRHVQ